MKMPPPWTAKALAHLACLGRRSMLCQAHRQAGRHTPANNRNTMDCKGGVYFRARTEHFDSKRASKGA